MRESGEAEPKTESTYSDKYDVDVDEDEAPAGSGNEGDETIADAPS